MMTARLFPDTGPLAGRAELQAYRDMLASTYGRLLKLKNEAKSTDEAIAEKPLKDLEAKWGGGIFTVDKWISVVYPAVF